ncbi:hypothetical protein [Pseudomonas sp. Irchel 3H7]|jgi:hypothetical protein|uniref:hypothetical protein n=1 Tax=Pseudomonas sp. Irchel 3H7 TaxID=2009042 RepID=UPI00113FCAD1|nr:hypothetical protein [Pseudomonas sp. Irchel 3H7]
MSHPINGDYSHVYYGKEETILFRITSHDEASGKFSGELLENQFTPSSTSHNINGWFSFNRSTSSTSFTFETPTDKWDLQSPYLESPNQFGIMNAIRTPKDKSQPPQNWVLLKTNSHTGT